MANDPKSKVVQVNLDRAALEHYARIANEWLAATAPGDAARVAGELSAFVKGIGDAVFLRDNATGPTRG